jgi:uncharacterized membrane protein YccC
MSNRSHFDWRQHQGLFHAARNATAATVAVLVARLIGFAETYWAAMTILIVMQSDARTTFSVSVRRLAGTALGATFGAALASCFGPNAVAFGAGVFLLGLFCEALSEGNDYLSEYFDQTTYRYGNVTLAVVMLIAHYNSAWIMALHRFFEAAIGIAVGLLMAIFWPEPDVDGVQS